MSYIPSPQPNEPEPNEKQIFQFALASTIANLQPETPLSYHAFLRLLNGEVERYSTNLTPPQRGQVEMQFKLFVGLVYEFTGYDGDEWIRSV